MSQKRALVTGATGAIGPALVHHLSQSGYFVRVLSRHPFSTTLLPDNTEIFYGDITDNVAVRAVVTGIDTVFHLAAKLHISNPSKKLKDEYTHVNVEGTRCLVNNAEKQGVKRFIYFSTVKVYGMIETQAPVNEDYPAVPTTMYAESKLNGETVVKDAQLESVILRLSAVYGPRLRGSWRHLTKAIKSGLYVPIGNLQNRRSLTYVDDVALAAQFVAEHEKAKGQIFNVVGHANVSMHEIYSAIYNAFDRPLPRWRVPSRPVVAGVGALDSILSMIGRQSPLQVEQVKNLINTELYSGEALESLGFKATTTLIQGWQQTITTGGF